MRLFVAIDIPAEIKERLRVFVERMRPLAKISWSPVENLHITTKFIGEWPEARLQEMKDALIGLPQCAPMDISIRNLGWFPSEARPREFWAGVVSQGSVAQGNDAGNPLAKLAYATDQATANLGVALEERAYSPHLTLARIRESISLEALRRAIEKESTDFGSFRATQFFLYLSKGGKYTQLAGFPLKQSQ